MPKIKVTNPKYVIDAHLKTNYFKLKNTGGPKGDKGDKGDTGATGPEGPQGATGATGRAATVAIGTTQTLNPGQSAFVNNVGTNNDAIFNFGIPQGQKGDKGDTGATGATGATGPQGPTGATGATGPQGPVGSVKSTVVSELPESGNSDTFYLVDREATTGTASGTHISFNNPEPNGEISDYDILGNIEQTTYTGDNLLNVEKTTQTVSGVTFTINEDKTIIANGTASALITFNLINTTFTLASGQYYLSGCPSGGSDSTYRLDINNGADGNQRDYGNGSSFTLSESTTISNVRIRIASGATVNRLEFKPMINTGSAAQPYEPYVGGIPAPNPSYPQPIETVTGRQTVGIVGKNLYDPNSTVFSLPAIVSVSVDGDTVTATALETTTSNGLFWRTPIPDSLLENGKDYTASCVLGSGAYRSLRLQLRNHDGSNAGFSNDFTVTYDDRYTLFVVENPFATTASTTIAAGTTCTISNIQVEEGSQATAFEPFNGQDYEINLGKNLWDTTVENGGLDANGNTFVSTTQLRSIGYVEVEPNTEYSFSNTNNLVVDRICYYSGNKTFIERGAYLNTGVFTTPNNGCRYARLVIRATNGSDITPSSLVNAQLEKGYTASSYSAYSEPIELCKIGTYQDRIYKENGKWYLYKEIGKVVFDGSESWSLVNSGASNFCYNLAVFVTPKDQDIMPVSNYFIGTPITSGNTSVGLWITNAGTIRARKETEQTLADYKTWLSTVLPSVYYVLATPTTTEITNAALTAQLEAMLNAELYTGQNNISVGSADLAGPLDITYALFDKTNRHKVYIWSDSDNTWQIIVP